MPATFGEPQGQAVGEPHAGAAPGGRPPRPGERPPIGGAMPPPPSGISASPAAAGTAAPASDSPEAALAAKVKRLAELGYEDREREIAKERPLFQRAMRKRVEEYLEKNKK